MYKRQQTDLEGLYLTPIRTDDKGWQIYQLDETGGRVPLTVDELIACTEPVFLVQILDPAWEEAGYTTLELSGPVSVFLEGELLFTTSPGLGDHPETVHLPDEYEVPAAGEVPRFWLWRPGTDAGFWTRGMRVWLPHGASVQPCSEYCCHRRPG